MRKATELIAVRKAVGVDLGVQATDQEMIEIAQRILAAVIDAAGVGQSVAQRYGALLVQHFAGDDLHADRQVRQLGPGFAKRRRLLQRRTRIIVVGAVAIVSGSRCLSRRLRRLVSARRSSASPQRWRWRS